MATVKTNVLEAGQAARMYTLEETAVWLADLAQPAAERDLFDRVRDLVAAAAKEEPDDFLTDFAANVDHYLYGCPKQDEQ